jgi:hypothetical protein
MIQEAYCSFEVSKLLKEKGFNCPCKVVYSPKGIIKHYLKEEVYAHNLKGHKKLCQTHQMAMAWLREVHNICIIIEPHAYDYINEKNTSYVYSLWQGDNYYENPELKSYPSYEEAVEAALKYVLKNLI